MNRTRESAILRNGILEKSLKRTENWDVRCQAAGGRCREFMKELISSVHEKHQAQMLPSIKVVAGLFSDNIQLLRENDNYISSEVANLP